MWRMSVVVLRRGTAEVWEVVVDGSDVDGGGCAVRS